MLTFILGTPCSGKSREMTRRTAIDLENGREVVFIVPEQNVLSSEREISNVISTGTGLFNLETVSFRRLCDTVFRRAGGLCYNYLDKSGQAIFMWRVLSELSPDLSTYKTGDNTDIGLISSLIGLYDEFYDYKVSPLDFEYAVAALPKEMRAKAEDISTVYTRYDELIHDGYDSSKDDILRAAEKIKENHLFGSANVYIDNFSGFTPCQYELIEAIMTEAENVYVSLCMTAERDQDIFANLIDTKNRLCEIAQRNNIPIAEDILITSSKNGEMKFFENYCYDPLSSLKYDGECKAIECITASDIYDECELIAADIMREIRNGLRFRDICIVAQDMSAYEGKLDAVLRRHNIPFHFNSNNCINDMPMYKMLICALDIITYNWRLDDVISYLKTGLCRISDDDADLLEEYALTWSVSGALWKLDTEWSMNPNGYTDKRDPLTIKNIVVINRARDTLREDIITLGESLSPRTTLDEAARYIYKFIEKAVSVDSMNDEETVCFNSICSVLEQLSLCGGKTEIGSTENLKRLIKMLASMADISVIPSRVDEINCTSINGLRSSGYKKCYIIGAVDGAYPCPVSNGSIIDEDMRAHLCEAGLKLPHDPDEAYTEDVWLFWKAVLSADRTAVCRYASTLDANKVIASPCIYELKKLFGYIKELEFSVYDRIYDTASAFDALTSKDKFLSAAVREILIQDDRMRNIVDSLETPIETALCSVDDPGNLKLYSGDINLTQSRIDSYVKCKFAYHLQYVLNLNEQRKITYDPRDVGVFIHALLEEYFRRFRNAEKEGMKLSREDIDKTVSDIVSAYRVQTVGDSCFVSKRLEALFLRLKRAGILFVQSIYDEFENSDFSPVLFEVSIEKGDDKGISPYRVELSDGSFVYIYGQIDRVDTYEKDGQVYVKVVDYKTGKKEFSRADLEKGLNLQMFLYMLSVMENGDRFCKMIGSKGKIVPAGVLYYIARLPSDTGTGVLTGKALEKALIDNISRQGLVLDDPDILTAMSKDNSYLTLPDGIVKKSGSRKERPVYTLEGFEDIRDSISRTLSNIASSMKSGIADAIPNEDEKDPCGNCRMRAVCRHSKEEVDDGE